MAMWYDWNATLFHQNIPKCWTAKRKWTRLRYDAAIQCRWYFSRFVRWLVTGRSTTKNMRESMRLAHFSLLSSIHTNLIRSSVVERLKRWTQCKVSVIQRPRVQVPLWLLAGFVVSSPELKSTATPVKIASLSSQQVLILPVGIPSLICFIIPEKPNLFQAPK